MTTTTTEPPIAVYPVATAATLRDDARHYLTEAIACLQPDRHDETGALGYARDAGMKLTRGVERVAEVLPTEDDPMSEACTLLSEAITFIGIGTDAAIANAVTAISYAVASIRLAGRARYVAWAIVRGEDTSLAAADAWLERRRDHGPTRAIGTSYAAPQG